MKILLLNGNPDFNNLYFDAYLNSLSNELSNNGHQVKELKLASHKIISCTGCWNCWLKSPGICSIFDFTHYVCEQYIKSDLVVFCSPLVLGFPSSLIKNTMDKLIPLLLPYLDIVNKEFHHQKRYENYPDIGYIIQEEEDTDTEDFEIIEEFYSRFAINFRSRLSLSAVINYNNQKEICHAVNHI